MYIREENFALFVFIFAFFVLVVLCILPIIGYQRKRLKGAAIGCVLQIIAGTAIIFGVTGAIVFYQLLNLRKEIKSAMVTVKSTEALPEGNTDIMWYLKTDEECLQQIGEDKKNIERFDIIRVDSLSLCVEDRILVVFDLKNQKATATDYDTPIEVVSVDWEKIKSYFSKPNDT